METGLGVLWDEFTRIEGTIYVNMPPKVQAFNFVF